MADSYLKKENNKKKIEKQKQKAQRREERKHTNTKGQDADNFMYVDEFGQLTDIPPHEREREEINLEDIQLGARKIEEESPIKKGFVHFLSDKGYGFITENDTKENVFFHINNCNFEVKQGHKVAFEKERGEKGYNAINIEMIK